MMYRVWVNKGGSRENREDYPNLSLAMMNVGRVLGYDGFTELSFSDEYRKELSKFEKKKIDEWQFKNITIERKRW